jgi:hypothetical protein
MNFRQPLAVGLMILGISVVPGRNAIAQTRIGLHVTQEELAIWKQRAASGPYKMKGDVSTNSPGDWTRIQSNANAFLSNPSAESWSGQQAAECLKLAKQTTGSYPSPGRKRGDKLRDAAFAYIITGDSRYRDAAKKELLAQAAQPGTNFANKTRWCGGITGDDAPTFDITTWLTKLLFGYSYIRGSISAEERATLDTWFLNAGTFWEYPSRVTVEKRFPNRNKDDYATLGSGWHAATCTFGKCITHYNGWKRYNLQEGWNNRAGSQVRFYGLVGIFLDNSYLKSQAKRYLKEWLRYAVFPDGTQAEFSRWTDIRPGQGWQYAGLMLGSMITLADHFARSGDTELYNYETSEGISPMIPAGGPKSLRSVLTLWLKHVNLAVVRYGTDQASRYGQPSYLIKSHDELVKEARVHDIIAAQANVYFKDSFLKSIYTRTAAGAPAYPSYPASGGYEPWGGEWGLYPGVLFMFGQMEGKVWPYSGAAQSGAIVSPSMPINLTVQPIDK